MSFHSRKNATIMIIIIMYWNENINQHLIWKENSRFFSMNSGIFLSSFVYLDAPRCCVSAPVEWWRQMPCPSVTEPTDGAEEPLSKQPNERLYQGVFTMWAPCTKLWLMVSPFFKYIFIVLHFCSLFFGGLTACVRTATNISTDVK